MFHKLRESCIEEKSRINIYILRQNLIKNQTKSDNFLMKCTKNFEIQEEQQRKSLKLKRKQILEINPILFNQ